MTSRKVFALTLAAALLSAPFAASAASSNGTPTPGTRHAAATRHHAIKPVRSTRASRATMNSDNSADSLNAQSLARSRGQQ
jgi:hypothetical protein